MFSPDGRVHCDTVTTLPEEPPVSISEPFSPAKPSSAPAQLAWSVKQGKGSAVLPSAGGDDDARALQQIGSKARIARNETIFSQGDSAAYAYKVVSGVVRLCKHMS